MLPAGSTLAASRGRSAAAPVQPANAAKVNLTEVRLQLQRKLKQQVRSLCKATGCGGSRCMPVLCSTTGFTQTRSWGQNTGFGQTRSWGCTCLSIGRTGSVQTRSWVAALVTCWPHNLQERRIAELESQLAESQQQLEAAHSNRTVTQEALDQVSPQPAAVTLGRQLQHSAGGCSTHAAAAARRRRL